MRTVRPAAVAGAFYPSNAARLASDVDDLVRGVKKSVEPKVPKAMIVPHAGYIYSGRVAAAGYAQLRAARDRIRRVVLLGPSHFVRVHGLALPAADAMQTPLGEIPVDADSVRRAKELPAVVQSPQAHAREHSLEVQLPFLQRVLVDFTVVPFSVGDVDPEAVSAVIDALWGGNETLVLVSTDLSHYLPYDQAVATDRRTAQHVLELWPDLIGAEDACGATPVNGLLVSARRKQLPRALLDLRNSGDTAGPRCEVVGYGAFAFYENHSSSSGAERPAVR